MQKMQQKRCNEWRRPMRQLPLRSHPRQNCRRKNSPCQISLTNPTQSPRSSSPLEAITEMAPDRYDITQLKEERHVPLESNRNKAARFHMTWKKIRKK